MNRLKLKSLNQKLRSNRVRTRLQGTAQRPRLSVHVSNLHVSAQIIDDDKGTTLVAVSTSGSKAAPATKLAKATWVGQEIAKKAKLKKIKHIAFDRGSRLYHGRIKALADAAREGGLEF